MIIVIDGPAGSGKSSTAKSVADQLSIQYLDSGALYRAATVIFIEANKKVTVFNQLLDQKEITFRYSDSQFKVKIDQQPVTQRLRKPNVSEQVSEVAAMPEVRDHINELMRHTVSEGVFIAEGRDLGTAVFPDARLKFYMEADLDERARRRYDEQKSQNPALTYEAVKESIAARDKKDANRENDPLKKSDDAMVIDTTNLTFEQQVEQLCTIIKDNLNEEVFS